MLYNYNNLKLVMKTVFWPEYYVYHNNDNVLLQHQFRSQANRGLQKSNSNKCKFKKHVSKLSIDFVEFQCKNAFKNA